MNMYTTKNTLDHAVVAFDELPPSGAYSIAIYTRCGRSTDFNIVRKDKIRFFR